MAGIDKAAIGWTIAIVAAGVGIAVAGTGVEGGTVPSIASPSMSDDRIEAAMETIAQERAMREAQETAAAQAAQGSAEAMDEMVFDEVVVDDSMSTATAGPGAPAAPEPRVHRVSNPAGTGVPGCEATNECYVPSDLAIRAGDTVSWTNDDSVPHTVTAGALRADVNLVGEDYPGGFDSGIMAQGGSFDHTFGSPGEYPYFCILHPWMSGTVTVG